MSFCMVIIFHYNANRRILKCIYLYKMNFMQYYWLYHCSTRAEYCYMISIHSFDNWYSSGDKREKWSIKFHIFITAPSFSMIYWSLFYYLDIKISLRNLPLKYGWIYQFITYCTSYIVIIRYTYCVLISLTVLISLRLSICCIRNFLLEQRRWK